MTRSQKPIGTILVSKQTGALANSLATEATRAASSFEQAGRFIAFILQAFVYFFVALTVSWQATLIAILCGLVILILFKVLLQVSQKAGSKQTNLLSILLTDLTDLLGCFKALKAMQRDKIADQLLKSLRKTKKQCKKFLVERLLRNLQEPSPGVFCCYWLVCLHKCLENATIRGDDTWQFYLLGCRVC